MISNFPGKHYSLGNVGMGLCARMRNAQLILLLDSAILNFKS